MFNKSIDFVTTTFGLTLETLAFISSEPAAMPASPPPEPILVRLPVMGGLMRHIELVAGRGFGRTLAANLLGMAMEDAEADLRCVDSLKELMNITGGALLANGGDENAVVPEMGIPEAAPFSADADWDSFVESADACVFDAEGNTIALRIRGAT